MTLSEKTEQAITGRPNSFIPAHTTERMLGLRPMANAMFWVTRLTTDETMEVVSGVGKPPWSWPAKLASVDVFHKGVYAFATGMVADRLASTPPPLAQRTGGHGPRGSF